MPSELTSRDLVRCIGLIANDAPLAMDESDKDDGDRSNDAVILLFTKISDTR